MKRQIFRLMILTIAALTLWQCKPVHQNAPATEARGVWLHRFEYAQYSRTHDQDSIRQYIADVIDNAAKANFNIIFFQVRGNGDAYYKPGLEPWGSLLTGELGKDPGWDPLEFAIERAHKRGLELHAWVNTFPVWRGRTAPTLTQPLSPYLKHPEWLICDAQGQAMPLSDHYVSFSPGIPAVHKHIITVVMDIAKRYHIDGIHFDYIRYPEESGDIGYSHDAISVSRFNDPATNPQKLDWDDWQRDQITCFVSKMYNELTAFNPALKMSAAVIGSYIDGGWNGYHAVYQDGRRWTELGKIDFLAPMIYWPRSNTTHPFTKRSNEWVQYYSSDRYVFPGIGSYRYTGHQRSYNWNEVSGEIEELRENGISGQIFFDAASLKNHWRELAAGQYKTPVKIPPMPWKGLPLSSAVKSVTVTYENGSYYVRWPEVSDAYRYIIYLSNCIPVDSALSAMIWKVKPIGQNYMKFNTLPHNGYLSLSTVNAAWEESPLSTPIRLDNYELEKIRANSKSIFPNKKK